MKPAFESDEVPYRYVVGIDLGTTNSAVSYVDRTLPEARRGGIRFFEIPQLVAPGETARRPVLPSFLYLPGPYELPEGGAALPWDRDNRLVVGEFAREQGALVPGRLVSSAKSWLCHGGVDRTAPILPWGAGEDVAKVSPVEASCAYLRHLKDSWNHSMARGREGLRLEEQCVILTVPASFDEVARELTVAAAREAGLARVILVEEPLAAFYAWLSLHQADWGAMMRPGQLILVCDVGGGTTDFTVVAVREGEQGIRFDRLAVGDHLMLGGDNMDLALARFIEVERFGRPGQLDTRRWHQLWHQCRKAKEMLLAVDPMDAEASPGSTGLPVPPAGLLSQGIRRDVSGGGSDASASGRRDRVDISVVGTGKKLIADTLKAQLTREQVQSIILEGFFPRVALSDHPEPARRTGLTEWGLPYVREAAVTRHLAAFWDRFRSLLAQETGRSSLYPDYVLFNGGALTPAPIRARILEVLQEWFRGEAGPDWAPVELDNPRPELSVAVGAAYYGLVRLGEGVRVGAGSPRAYYVQVSAEESGQGGPDPVPTRAVCLVPRGTEEGFETELAQPAFEVLTNQPAAFQLLCSSTRLGDRLGEVLSVEEHDVTVLPPIRTVLRYGKKGAAVRLPVRLAIRLTEVGTLELWCRSQQSPHRWQLQFDVRQGGEPPAEDTLPEGETLDVSLVEHARQLIRATYAGTRVDGAPAPERLVKELTAVLDLGRDKWPTSLIRPLADALLDCRKHRGMTAQHESRWLNLLGFCMRPGFGDPLDAWRAKEIWKLFHQGPLFARQPQNRSEWWVFWRRVAGGLSAGHQLHFHQQVSTLLPTAEKKKKAGKAQARISSPQEELEIWMALASMERLPAATKRELGNALLARSRKLKAQELWALSRLGARIPFYGPLDQVIPRDVASEWLTTLLELPLEPSETLARSLVHLARMTGDRERDLPLEIRERLADYLTGLPHGERLRQMLFHAEADYAQQEKDWVFGETLPSGLILSQGEAAG